MHQSINLNHDSNTCSLYKLFITISDYYNVFWKSNQNTNFDDMVTRASSRTQIVHAELRWITIDEKVQRIYDKEIVIIGEAC